MLRLYIIRGGVCDSNENRYINALLTEHRRRILEAQMIAALKQDADDSEYQAEIAAWDNVVGDGINARE